MRTFTRRLSLLSLLLAILWMSGCENDEPVAEKSPLYKITFPDSAIPARETERWVWVTDQRNQVIHTARLLNNQIVEVEYPTDHAEGDTYSLSFLSFFNDAESYHVNTFTRVEGGEYSVRSNATFQRTPVGNFSLTINNAPATGFAIKGRDLGDGGSLNRNGTVLSAIVPLAKNPGSLTCFFIPSPTTAPRFKKLADVAVSSSHILNYSDFAPMEIERHFSFPDAVYISFSISAVETENDKLTFSYSLYSNQFFTGDKNLSLYFSNVIAPKALTSISYTTANKVFSYGVLADQLPSSFKQIGAEIISSTASNNRINVVTTGTYDAAATTVTYLKDLADVTWTWYHPNQSQTILERPAIPSEILSNHPMLAENFSLPSTILYDYSGEVTYNQFVQNSIRGSYFYNLSTEVSTVQNY